MKQQGKGQPRSQDSLLLALRSERETPGNEVRKGGYFQYFIYLLGTDRLLRPRGGYNF